ncbi:MAG: MATE family efflux transporter [Clostridium sp.]
MATGGAVVCAQYIGKKRQDQACRAAGQLVLITAVLSLLIASAAFIGNRHLLRLIFELSRDRGYGQCGNVFLVPRPCHIRFWHFIIPARPCSVPWEIPRFP